MACILCVSFCIHAIYLRLLKDNYLFVFFINTQVIAGEGYITTMEHAPNSFPRIISINYVRLCFPLEHNVSSIKPKGRVCYNVTCVNEMLQRWSWSITFSTCKELNIYVYQLCWIILLLRISQYEQLKSKKFVHDLS